MTRCTADTRTLIAAAMACAGLCVLAGCDMQGRQPAPAEGAARLAPGAGFYFNQDGDTASLAYGRADSDDVDLMLQCSRGSHRVEVSALTPRMTRGAAPLTLVSGPVKSDLQAQVTPDEENAGGLASASAASDAPVLAAFRKTGRLSFRLAGRQQAFAATAGEQVGVARFFAACERKR
jgi:hypothetical protein